jgi:hypothetical protein
MGLVLKGDGLVFGVIIERQRLFIASRIAVDNRIERARSFCAYVDASHGLRIKMVESNAERHPGFGKYQHAILVSIRRGDPGANQLIRARDGWVTDHDAVDQTDQQQSTDNQQDGGGSIGRLLSRRSCSRSYLFHMCPVLLGGNPESLVMASYLVRLIGQ